MMEKKTHIFTDEEIKSLIELGEVLRSIHARLISEGYVIKSGSITKRNSLEQTTHNERLDRMLELKRDSRP